MPVKAKHDSGRRAALLRALANSLRFRIMIVLTEREATATELAEDLGEDFRRVCEHVNLLRRDGFIELVDTDIRNGGIQRIFRATARPRVSTEETETLTLDQREGISAAISQSMIMDLLLAIDAGTMDSRVERVLLRTPLLLDGEGFGEMDRLLCRTQDEVHEIEARCAERAGQSGETLTNATSSLSAFPLPKRPR